MITSLNGVPLSRSMMLAMARADREQELEDREAQKARLARQEQMERQTLAYYYAHGESPAQTVQRQALLEEQREERERVRRAAERVEQHQRAWAEAFMAGKRPRTHQEILEAARWFP
jgi:hypothetical protein